MAISTIEDNLYPMSWEAYSYLLTIVAMFVLGYEFISEFQTIKQWFYNFRNKKGKDGIIHSDQEIIIAKLGYREKKVSFNIYNYESGIIVWAIGIVLIAILIFYKIRYEKLLLIHGIAYNRLIKYTLGMLFRTPIENIVYIYIFQPVISIFAILLPIHIMNKKFKNPTIYISAILIYLSFCIGQGRLIVFETMFFFMLVFVFFNYKQILKILKERYIVVISVLGGFLFLIFFLSLVRYNTDFTDINSIMENSKTTFGHIFMYFTGSFRAFDVALNNGYRDIIVNSYGNTYGLATLCGLDEVVRNGINFIGIDIPVLNRFMGELTQQYVNIGPNTSMNAFFTAGLNYYIDFGVVGIIAFPFIYGGIVGIIINKTLKNKNVYMVIFMVLNLYYAIFSSVRWYYQYGGTWTTFLIILFAGIVHKWYLNSPRCESFKRRILKR